MQAWRTIFNQEGTNLILFVGHNLSPLNELGLRQSTNQTNINKIDHQLTDRTGVFWFYSNLTECV